MFDDKFFDDWLDSQAQKVMEKVASGEGIAPEQMMILMLKAQTNHFAHLDVDLRNEMVLLREDMDKRFEQMQVETAKRFRQWWWAGDNGKTCLAIRYGAKPLALNSKGANAIELDSRDDLLNTLKLIKDAVLAGELDSQIEAVSGAVKSSFKKTRDVWTKCL